MIAIFYSYQLLALVSVGKEIVSQAFYIVEFCLLYKARFHYRNFHSETLEDSQQDMHNEI